MFERRHHNGFAAVLSQRSRTAYKPLPSLNSHLTDPSGPALENGRIDHEEADDAQQAV